MYKEDLDRLKQIIADNDACSKHSVLDWHCDNCPIGKLMPDKQNACADGKASKAGKKLMAEFSKS